MRLALTWDGGHIVAARVAATRPLAARILVGQPADKAVALVPRLFSLCGQAQGIAARLAWLAARGEQATEDEMQAARRKVVLEAIGEHLWRLLLDWPVLFGRAPRKEEFLAWRKRLAGADDRVAATALGRDLIAWLERETEVSGTLDGENPVAAQTTLLPWLTAEDWAKQLIDDDFARFPSLAGKPAETGVLARQVGNAQVAALRSAGLGVAARIAARYADLRDLAKGLGDPGLQANWLDAAPISAEAGLARVETARGVLLHRIELDAERVARYVIVAPTEWNFHPQGAFVQEIVGCAVSSRVHAEASARSLGLALDPCVAYEVEIEDA